MALTTVKRIKSSEIQLKDRLVHVNRVAKVVKGGRRFSFSAVIVVGNGNGIVGYGLGKANEATSAIAKGIDDAKKSLINIPILGHTIPHDIYAKFGAAKVFLKPASAGTGVIAGGAMRAVLESAGIKDVLCKCIGSSNPHNVVKATVKALMSLRDPITISQLRGVKLAKIFEG